MKTNYDPKTDALDLRFADAAVVETEEVWPGVMIDLDAEGRIVAIEVSDASARLHQKSALIAQPEAQRKGAHPQGAHSWPEQSAQPTRRFEPIDAGLLRALTEHMPLRGEGAAALVRAMRDGDRY